MKVAGGLIPDHGENGNALVPCILIVMGGGDRRHGVWFNILLGTKSQ